MPSQTQYLIHPAAEIFPMMTEDEYQGLKEDIRLNGQLESIVVWCGSHVDGRHRLRVCEELGLQPKIKELGPTKDPWKYAISKNLHHRHLTTGMRAMIAAELHTMKSGRPSNDTTSNDAVSKNDLAKQMKVGTASLERAKQVLSSGDQGLINAFKSGEIKVSAAAKSLRKAPDKIKRLNSIDDDIITRLRCEWAGNPLNQDDLIKEFERLVGRKFADSDDAPKSVALIEAEGVADRGVSASERQVDSPVETVVAIYHSCDTEVRGNIASAIKSLWDINKPKKEKKDFVRPTVGEVRAYMIEKKTGISAEDFIDYYDRSNWFLKSGIKVSDWKACVRTWVNGREKEKKKVSDKQRGARYIPPEELRPGDGEI